METCSYCGLTHKKVEMNGFYHCPNRACFSSGTTWFRRTLKSYKEEENQGGLISVDPEELIKVIQENPWGEIILDEAEKHSLEKWKKQPENLHEVGILSDGTPLYSRENGAGGEFYLDCDGAIVFNSNDGLEKLSMILHDMIRKQIERSNKRNL